MAIKEFMVGGVVVALGLLVGATWQKIPDYPMLASLVLMFAIAWASATILIVNSVLRYGVSIASIAVLVISLKIEYWTFIGGIVGVAVAMLALWSVDRQYRAVCAFSFRFVLGGGFRIFLTALAIVFSFSYYGTIAERPVDASTVLPRNIFDIALRAADGVLQKQLPGFHRENTVDDTLAGLIRQQLAQNPNIAPNSVPSLETIKMELPAQRKEIIKNLNRDLGLSIDPDTSGDERIGAALYEASTKTIEPYLEPYAALVPWVMAISFFLALKTISVVYYYLMLLLLPALFWILQQAGIIEKKIVSAEKEAFELVK